MNVGVLMQVLLGRKTDLCPLKEQKLKQFIRHGMIWAVLMTVFLYCRVRMNKTSPSFS